MLAGWLTKSFHVAHNYNPGYNVCSYMLMQTRDYAARKGTRERRREKLKKKKVKAIVQKVGFIPAKRAEKMKEEKKFSPLFYMDDSWRKPPTDDVWMIKYHRRPVYSFKEIIECHRETHHPTMFNKPDAIVSVLVDLNIKSVTKKKRVDTFTTFLDMPHTFSCEQNQRKVLALCKDLNEQEKAKENGADSVGGTDVIKRIHNGSFSYKEYDYIVAHADILTDLLLIRGLLKKKFPNIRTGNLGHDMSKLVKKFKNGILYTIAADKDFREFGQVNVPFGLLNMDIERLEANFNVIINDVASRKTMFAHSIGRVRIKTEISPELLIINFKEYLPKDVTEETVEEEENTAIIASH